MVERDVPDADKVHRIEERAPGMSERDGGVVGEALSDQDVPVESRHLPDRKDGDTTERFRIDVEYLPLSDIGPDLRFRRPLETE